MKSSADGEKVVVRFMAVVHPRKKRLIIHSTIIIDNW